MNVKLLEKQAKEKFSLPENWEWFRWETLPHPPANHTFVKLTGCPITERYKSGKRKGRPKYSLATSMSVTITLAEHEAYLLAWEKETGQCSACTGSGEELERWHHIDGTKMRPCGKCNGSKKATVRG